MKQNGLSSKYLPGPSGNCDNPWCGTPVLITSPVGKTVADMIRLGQFGSDEAIRCCHDCLSALSTAGTAGIRHGDIRPENIICVTSSTTQQPYFVLVGWGHRHFGGKRPARYESSFFIDISRFKKESYVPRLMQKVSFYLLYFSSGGELPELDSVEGALEWRDSFGQNG
ncbi:putative protein kinase-like domain superfamily [Helianthus annuus]|nr:putative protein kinase-like domain superfamily [Helianthus annuus]